MKTTNNTVLITGGSAGIGFEIAKLLSEAGNKVIITGRTKDRLENALSELPNVTGIVSDVSIEDDVQLLVEKVKEEFPTLNIVINNAGRAYAYNLVGEEASASKKALDEMLTNYVSIVNLNEKLLPLLKQQPEAAIVNGSSIVSFVPGKAAPTYAASKAALHSYTKTLRIVLQETNIKVFELMPPLVNTDFSQEIGGSKGIHPSVVAEDLLSALESNTYEIRVGLTEQMYRLSLASPEEALVAMNS